MTPLLAPRLRTDRSFERIYRKHVGDVYRYALAVMRNPSDAEDVAQTTFMNAYRAFERGERPQNPQHWLIAIAHNVCRQRFRQSSRRPEEVAYDDGVLDIVPEEERGPSAEDIQRALGHLAFNQRAALVMRELEGRSYAEIAEVLDVSVSAVETLIFRGRRALREQLEGSLTCGEAERAISRQLDGRLSRAERGALRAHLRECRECERFARSQRAQRAAIKALAAVPIPTSLTSLFGGGAATGSAVALKAAAFVAAGTVAAGVGYEGAKRADVLVPRESSPPTAAVARESAAPTLLPAAVERPPNAGRPVADAKPAAKAPRPAKEKAAKPAAAGPKKEKSSGPPSHAVARGKAKTKAAQPEKRRPVVKATPPGRVKERPSPPAAQTPKAKKPIPQPAKPAQGKKKEGKSVRVGPPLPSLPPLPAPLDGTAQELPAPGI